MKRLTNEQWHTILGNMKDLEKNEKEEFGDWVEVVWLEGNGIDTFEEWVLAYGYECFEDGFKTEKEAIDRLREVENMVFA